ncbi:hypothetical protein PV402_40000 [Streptomyces scabiei]|uniref:hypothetical protein n=1 Tax=Streptomyces scabiei TaxID=1930 RepID=UPI0029B1CA3F|nr:hypothetical protein [Streptomyces scabiei]MDX2658372.1 hypothetical protein [Streptomyces scabiei]MDX2870528.1 hypothetical protein [Streptomyces scabiei]
MDIQPYTSTETLAVGRPWLMSMLGIEANQSITLDLSRFSETLHWTPPTAHQTDRKLKSGIPLGKITASGLYAPYNAVSNEVQTLTVTGAPTGGTFTITWSGQTTAAIAYNATAAAVQAALEALSNIAPGDVAVTGAAGGPWTLTWGGAQLGENVAAPTTTESFTGGTSPDITIATTTAGGAAATADGADVFAGFLFTEVAYAPTATKVAAPLMVHGQIDVAKLPVAFDPTDVPAGSNTQFVYKV